MWLCWSNWIGIAVEIMVMNFDIKSLSFCLTDSCNLNCKFCYADAKKKGSFLDYVKAKKFLEFFSKFAIPRVSINFIGGEPTLYPQLLDLIDFANENLIDPFIQISTNGVISLEKLNKLLEKKVYFYLSFEGLPEFQDFERPFHDSRGSSEIVIKTIKTIISNDPDKLWLRINYSTNKIGKEKKIAEFIKSLGVKNVSLGVLNTLGRGKAYENVNVTKCSEEVPKLADALLKEGVNVKLARLYPYAEVCRPSCKAGISSFSITVDGKVATCHKIISTSDIDKNHKIFVIGDINNEVKIDQIRLKVFNDFAKILPEKCISCDISIHCGGCPFEKIFVKEKVVMSKWFCDFKYIGTKAFKKYFPLGLKRNIKN